MQLLQVVVNLTIDVVFQKGVCASPSAAIKGPHVRKLAAKVGSENGVLSSRRDFFFFFFLSR